MRRRVGWSARYGAALCGFTLATACSDGTDAGTELERDPLVLEAVELDGEVKEAMGLFDGPSGPWDVRELLSEEEG